MAQALPFVGAAIGGIIGGPQGAQVGWFLGSMLSSQIDPQKIEGPRMSDLRVQTSTYGKPLPIIYGTQRIAGNMIWSAPIKEVKNEERAGKGGPVNVTYKYFANSAISICEGPITGVRRIWADGKLIYDNATTAKPVVSRSASPFIRFGDLSNGITPPDQTRPGTLGGGKFSSDNPFTHTSTFYSDIMNADWHAHIPAGYVFNSISELDTAVEGTLSRNGITRARDVWGVTYTNDSYRLAIGYGYVATFHLTDAAFSCGNGYQFNAVTNVCEPIFPVGENASLYSALADSGTAYSAPTGPIAHSITLAHGMTLYFGSEDQLPDPNMESFLGAGKVPAFRGQGYIVLTDYPLAKFGNRVPNFEFEVIARGAYQNTTVTIPGTVFGITDSAYAYDRTRGQLWSLMAGQVRNNHVEEYTVMDVERGTREYKNFITAPAANGTPAQSVFQTTLIRYEPVLDAYLVLGIANGAYGFAQISPVNGYVIKTFPANFQAPGAVGANVTSFAYDSKHFLIWFRGTSQMPDGSQRIGIYTANLISGVVSTITESVCEPDGFEARNGSVNSIEYDAKSDQVFVAHRERGFGGGAISRGISIYNASTLAKVDELPSTQDAWMLIEPATSALWFYDGVGMKRRDSTTGVITTVVSAPAIHVLSATADGIGNVGVFMSVDTYGMAAFDSTGKFLGKIITSGGLSPNTPTNMFADHARSIIAVGTGYIRTDSLGDAIVTVADVFKDISGRMRLKPEYLDVTDVAGSDCIVQGYGLLNRVKARDALQPMLTAYGLSVLDDGTKVRVVRSSQSYYAGLIPLADQAGRDGSGNNDYVVPMQVTRAHDLELPKQVEIVFDNPELEYRHDVRRAKKIAHDSNVDIRTISLPMVMSSTRAQTISEMLLAQSYLSRTTYELSVTGKYAALNAGDVVDVELAEGGSARVIITKLVYSPSGIIKLTCSGFDYSVFGALTTVPVAANVISSELFSPANARVMLLDIPLLSSSDDGSGCYLLAYAQSGHLGGSDVFVSADGSNYSHQTTLAKAATVGSVMGTLPSVADTTITDTASVLTVLVSSGNLYSATDFELNNGANLALVGREIIQFANAMQNADGSYTLTNLRRGLKGTENAVVHQGGETFVFLSSYLQKLALSIELNGVSRFYKVLAPGQSIEDAPAYQFANTDVCLKPLSGTRLAGTRAGGDLTATWARRSRVASAPLANGFLPLGETTEAYEIDVLDSFGTVKRTLTATAPSVVYTAAQQAADFGSAQSTVHLRVYQLSSAIGRGFALDGNV